jgi:hypothetical protein
MKFKSDIEVQAGLKDSSGANGSAGQVLSSNGSTVSWVNETTVASDVQNEVKASVAINKGQAVYVTGADGTNIIVGLASNTTEATSSKTLGLLNATVAINGFADVVQIGRLAGLNTSAATVGDPVWLGTNGNLIYGLANKPYAPAHLVFIGVVTRVNANNGEIFINVQNGFELNEIHDVDIKTDVPINGDILGYNGTLWVNKTIAEWLGYTPANDALVVHKAGVETITGEKTFTASRTNINGTLALKGGSATEMYIGSFSTNRLDFGVTNLGVTYQSSFIFPYTSQTYSWPSASGTVALTSQLHNPVTIGTANGLSLAGQVLSLDLSSASTNGALSSTDWTTFNNKQNRISFLEFNDTNKTVWNNGNGNIADNTSFGELALATNTSGFENTAYGQSSLNDNTTGNYNTATGAYSLTNNISGIDNTASGSGSLRNNETGNSNTGVGKYALTYNIGGSYNTSIGDSSGNLTSGGLSVLSINNSVFIGAGTRALNQSGDTNEIVIGYNAIGIGSNTVTLGNTSITTTRLRGAVLGGSFVKDGGTADQYLKADGSVSTAMNSRVEVNFIATSGQTTFTTPYEVGQVEVYYNGSKLYPDEFVATNGTTIVLVTPATLNAQISIVKFVSSFNTTSIRTETVFTTTAGQTTFSVNYAIGQVDVFYNGSKLSPAEFTATNGTSVVLGFACAAGESIVIDSYVNQVSGAVGTNNKIAKFTGTASLGDSQIFDNGTIVGIGTGSSGGSRLNILNIASNPFLSLRSTDNVYEIAKMSFDQSTDLLSIVNNQGASTSGIVFSTSATERMRIKANGDIKIQSGSLLGWSDYSSGSTGVGILGASEALEFFTSGSRKMIIGSDGAMGFNYPVLGSRSFMFRAYASRPLAIEVAESGGVQSLYLRPNASGRHLISSNYLSGGVYLPLALSGRENDSDLVLHTSGNVLIGTSTDAGYKLDVNGTGRFSGGNLQLEGGSYPAIQINGGSTGGGGIRFLGSTENYAEIFGEYESANNGILLFRTRRSGTIYERMRITSGGFTKMSNYGSYYNTSGSFHEIRSDKINENAVIISNTASSQPYGPWIYFGGASPNNTSQYFLAGSDTSSNKFFIWSNGSMANATGSYGTISDIKYKENIADATSKLEDILQLKVRNFNFIGDDTKQIGFIAQEFEEVFPGMVDVSTEKAEGSEEAETYKSIKTSVLIPILVKAMQEQQAQIKELQDELVLLKNK